MVNKPTAGTEKVRLTIWPDEVKEVPAEEVPILRAQGLLIEDDGTAGSASDDSRPPRAAAGARASAAAARPGEGA
jgi:hypothetical protein